MNFLEIFGTLLGLLYLFYEYRASRLLWPLGVVMPCVYLVVYYRAGLYADFGINVYYILAGAYGWWMWSRSVKTPADPLQSESPLSAPTAKEATKTAEEAAPTRMPLRFMPHALAAFALAFAAIAWVLVNFTDSNVPYLDAFTTAASIVALWMLARKWCEQWLVWIAVDGVSAGLYVYKDLHFTAALYALYTIIAVAGYRRWRRMEN